MKPKLPRLFLYFLAGLFALNLLQSYFTELIFDEAYYWYYAQKMAWGYFDHPPMVALLIKISSYFFKGELGVRFMSCILSAATFLILWFIVDHPKKNKYIPHFFVLVFSMTLINAYGFFTLPDTPLLFFTALFLLVYKKFLQTPNMVLAMTLGFVMACLMYSKYHAVLVIVFVLLSNLRLVFNRYAWLAVGVALLCYTPHFIWLYLNDFVSIKYHISERPNRAYEFTDFTLGFLINLIALFGLTFFWIYKSLFKTKASGLFTKALLYLIYGVLLFFFISSFNRRVQTQWLIVICIPLIVVVYNYSIDHENTRKWIFRLGMVNCVLLLYARLALIYQPLSPILYESHGNKTWAHDIQTQIGAMPVVFENSYRNAPMYAFYTGSSTYSLNNIMYRQNQYSIDDSESRIQHKKVLYVSKYMKQGDISFYMPNEVLHFGKYIDNFESFRKLECFFEAPSVSFKTEKEITVKLYNPYSENISLDKLQFNLAYLNTYKQVEETHRINVLPLNAGIDAIKSKDTTAFTFKMPATKLEHPGYFKIGISENNLYMGINSKNIRLH